MRCLSKSGNAIPWTCADLGKSDCAVNQGIVFISSNTGHLSVSIASIRAYFVHCTALYAFSAILCMCCMVSSENQLGHSSCVLPLYLFS